MLKIKKRILTLMGLSLMMLTLKAEAGHLHCMGAVTDFVLTDFIKKRGSNALIVHDANNDYAELNLGSNVEEASVEIKDIHKNTYSINIHLYAIDDLIVRKTLRTTVPEMDYSTCTFDQNQDIQYIMFEKRN